MANIAPIKEIDFPYVCSPYPQVSAEVTTQRFDFTRRYGSNEVFTRRLTLSTGPGGIRFTDHASAFPAQINAAATWDKELCRRRGEALGAEARGKGCHV